MPAVRSPTGSAGTTSAGSARPRPRARTMPPEGRASYAELDPLTADLPRGRPLPASRRPRAPGERAFAERVVSPASREDVADQVIARLGPLLGERGFDLVSHDDRAIVFEREYRPAWTIA